MQRRTKVNIKKNDTLIELNHSIFSIGSCFSNEIAQYLKAQGINIKSNPFGTLYNTHSIKQVIKHLFEEKYYHEDELIHENGIYFSPDHTTRFDYKDIKKCLSKINENMQKTISYIHNCKVFIITPGTSIVWYYQDKIVANCHKLPHALFIKKTLTLEENKANLQETIKIIKQHVENPLIILTLSPIRHQPAHLVENSYSKALLRAAIEPLIDKQNVYYFPAYEIVLDELRNYSIYKNDLIHLKKETVKYIINKFIHHYFTTDLINYIYQFSKIKKMLDHKPRNPINENYLTMLKRVLTRIDKLEKIKDDHRLHTLKIRVAILIVKYFYEIPETKQIIKGIFLNQGKLYDFFSKTLKFKQDKMNFENYRKIKADSKLMQKVKSHTLMDYLSIQKLV
ncbi:MAG: GSCFA domain-containing protein [Spirochaetes bacterium]|nr:GSCFA domain-containing protein [Spirochaetota bacterium]